VSRRHDRTRSARLLFLLLGLLVLGQATGLTAFVPEDECAAACAGEEEAAGEDCAPVCAYCATCVTARVFVPSSGHVLVPPAPASQPVVDTQDIPTSSYLTDITHVPKPAFS
jgi:hypothetical protein